MERPVFLCSMISKPYPSYRKKKKKNSVPEIAPAATPDDMSRVHTELNHSDFALILISREKGTNIDDIYARDI